MDDTFDAELAVKRGAALMDEYRPGWAQRISLEVFDIGACTRCILGQEFATGTQGLSHTDHIDFPCPYEVGLTVLGLAEERGDDYHYGFDCPGELEEDLSQLWRQAITERRARGL